MGARPLINFKRNTPQTENSEENNQHIEENLENVEGQHEEALNAEDAVKAFKKDFASKLGWTSKEDWEKSGRDSNLWRDEEDFLENSPTYFDRLRKKARDQENRMKRNAAAAAAVIEENTRQARADAEREAREAATAGDPDRAAAAVVKAAQAGPPPETVAWIARNAWFDEDPEARAVAAAAVERAATQKLSIAEQLEAAEKSVKKRFPEYFEEEAGEDDLPEFITRQTQRRTEEAPKREVRMSESTKVAAAAQNGPASSARVRDSKINKEKSFKDIPSTDQALYQKYFASRFQSRGMNVEQAQEKYAKTYWNNKE